MTNNSTNIVADDIGDRNFNHYFGPNIGFAERREVPVESAVGHRFTGHDRFPAVVAFGVICRGEGLPILEAHDRAEHWNQLACEPPLAEIVWRHAVGLGYFQPELADRIVSEPAQPGPQTAVVPLRGGEQAAPPPLTEPAAAEPASLTTRAAKKDRTAAERQRRYRERRKQAAVMATVTGADAITSVTQLGDAVEMANG
jgi:hypothetical protein